MKFCIIALRMFLLVLPFFGESRSELLLAGFMIGQTEHSIVNTLGKPTEVINEKDSLYYIYDSKINTKVFELRKISGTNYLYSIEVNQKNDKDFQYFDKAKFEFSGEEINKLFGKPTKSAKLQHGFYADAKSLPSEIWSYDDRNYSFIFRNNKVKSVKLFGLNGFDDKPSDSAPHQLLVYALSLETHYLFMICLMPSIKIIHSGKVNQIDEPFFNFVTNKESPVYKQLISESDSLLNILNKYQFSGPGMRFSKDMMQYIYKGSEDNPIDEMTFTFWAGQYRLASLSYKK